MGRKTDITQDRINQTANMLKLQGHKITIGTVREALGNVGSNSTISTCLDVWQASQIKPLAKEVKVPETIIEFLGKFISGEITTVRQNFESKFDELKTNELVLIKESEDRAEELEVQKTLIENARLEKTELSIKLQIAHDELKKAEVAEFDQRASSEKARTDNEVLKTRLEIASKELIETKNFLEQARGLLNEAKVEAAELRGKLRGIK